MNKNGVFRACVCLLVLSVPRPPIAQERAPDQSSDASHPEQEKLEIVALLDGAPTTPASGNVGLNHPLWVVLNRAPDVAAERYVLVLNGNDVKGLPPATTKTVQTAGTPVGHALEFKLKHVKDNDTFWRDLLGSPRPEIPVIVSLKQQPEAGSTSPPTLVGGDPHASTFQFRVFSGGHLGWAIVAVLLVFALVWGHSHTQTTLRDNLLPQLPPAQQPYSLGRWQMAFWFTLIFASFVFLFVLLWDYNTISSQALTLMGISGATALASVAIDAAKDSPADATNRGLQALGLSTYGDVLRLKQEIADRQAEAMRAPPAARLAQLQIEIQDRNNVLRTYQDHVRPFRSQGWFKDVTTDLNGTTIHRLQVVIWTAALGIVFVIGVYRDLAMPEFSATLLALMGISSAGYVGFKYPEKNN